MATNQSAWNLTTPSWNDSGAATEMSTAKENGGIQTGRNGIFSGFRPANSLLLDNCTFAIGSVEIERGLGIDRRAGGRASSKSSSGSDRSDRWRTGSSCWRCCAPARVATRRSTCSSSTSRCSTSSPAFFSYLPSSPGGSRQVDRVPPVRYQDARRGRLLQLHLWCTTFFFGVQLHLWCTLNLWCTAPSLVNSSIFGVQLHLWSGRHHRRALRQDRSPGRLPQRLVADRRLRRRRRSPHREDMWGRYCRLASFSDCRYDPVASPRSFYAEIATTLE